MTRVDEGAASSREVSSPIIRMAPWILLAILTAQMVAAGLFFHNQNDGSPIAKLVWFRWASTTLEQSAEPAWMVDGESDPSSRPDWMVEGFFDYESGIPAVTRVEEDQERWATSEPMAEAMRIADTIFAVDRVAGAILIGLAVWLWIRPSRLAFLVVALWFFLWSWGGFFRQDGRFWYIIPAAQAVRYLLPMALAFAALRPIWARLRGTEAPSQLGPTSLWILRIGIALTFLAHGFEAIAKNPNFEDYINLTAQLWLDWNPPQRLVRVSLISIGVIDVVVAVWILLQPNRWVALWMAFWGAITALSRMTSYGFDDGLHETVLRAANGGVPLVLALLWWSPDRRRASTDAPNRSEIISRPKHGGSNRIGTEAMSAPEDVPQPQPTVQRSRRPTHAVTGSLGWIGLRTRLGLWAIAVLASGLIASGLWSSTVTSAERRNGDRVEGTRPVQWRVIWKGQPDRRATISWSTAEPGSNHRVYYDTVPRGGDLEGCAYQHACDRNGEYTRAGLERLSSSIPTAYYHHARLENLEPGTTYFFVMVSDGLASEEYHFRTAPSHEAPSDDDPTEDEPISLLYGGDSRTGYAARAAINRMIASLVEQSDREGANLLGLVHGGDFVVRGELWAGWSRWLTDHELTTSESGRVLPIIPVRGNHDVGPLFNEIFDFDEGDENYYVSDVGPGVALVNLNSNINHAGPQRDWLKSTLSDWRGRTRWLVASYHRPVYPAVKTPGAGLMAWVPLFDRYDVDLAVEADGHVIKRTVPIRNGRRDPDGVTYIGEGGMGVPQRLPEISRWYLRDGGYTSRGHHLQLLDFTGTHLRIRTLRLEGQICDDHRIAARDRSVQSVD